MRNFFELYQLEPFTELVESFLIHQGTYAPLLLLLLEEAGVPLPIPGDVVVAYTGYEVSRGNIPYIAAFLLLLISVLIGSSILYYLSARFGQQIVLQFGHYLHLNERKLLQVEEKFRKYGVWVIIFGCHIPGFRIPITVFAGMSEMTYKTFIVSTFISVIFWIPFYLAVGQNLGPKTMQLLKGHQQYFLIVVIPFIIFICSIIYTSFKRKKESHTSKLAHTKQDTTMKGTRIKSALHDSIKRIRKTPALLVLSLEILFGVVISAITFLIFWELTDTVLDKERFFFDNTISMFFYHLRNPLLTSIMEFFSFIGADGILVLSVLIPLFFFWKKRKHEAILFSIMIGMGAIVNMVLKLITHRPRPTFAPLAIEHSLSFPSGHSMNSFIFFMTVAYFYYHFTHRKKHSLIAFFIATIIILCIGISRIYLGVHYPSDVLGGYVTGLLWFLFVILIDKTFLFYRLIKNKKNE